jgi:phosphoglucomutase
MMDLLEELIRDPNTVGRTYTHGKKTYKVALADNFCYKDPIDHSVSKNQVGGGRSISRR